MRYELRNLLILHFFKLVKLGVEYISHDEGKLVSKDVSKKWLDLSEERAYLLIFSYIIKNFYLSFSIQKLIFCSYELLNRLLVFVSYTLICIQDIFKESSTNFTELLTQTQSQVLNYCWFQHLGIVLEDLFLKTDIRWSFGANHQLLEREMLDHIQVSRSDWLCGVGRDHIWFERLIGIDHLDRLLLFFLLKKHTLVK